MHRMPARRLAFTDLDISTTEFSWAWVRGPAGAMVTGGAGIALKEMAEDDITVVVGLQPVAPMPIRDMSGQGVEVAQIIPMPELRMQPQAVPVPYIPRPRIMHLMLRLLDLRHMQRRLVPRLLRIPVEKRMAVARRMVAAHPTLVAAGNINSAGLSTHLA